MTLADQYIAKQNRTAHAVSIGRRFHFLILGLLSVVNVACVAERDHDSPDLGGALPACIPSMPPGFAAPPSNVSSFSPHSPASLRAAYLHARQAEAASNHAFMGAATASFRAENVDQGLVIDLDSTGLHLRSAAQGDQADFSLRLISQGCAAAPSPGGARAPFLAQLHRIEYRRPDITEWYLNGPLGLEHGFTVQRDLNCDDGKLAFMLGIQGEVEAKLAGDGAEARLVVRPLEQFGAGSLYVYSGLFAMDADGKELPSRLSLSGRSVRLEVDAAGARYPVTIDPTWREEATLTRTDAEASDHFAEAVALSGNTALIGVRGKTVGLKTLQGMAYVYVRSGPLWTEQAQLVASDGTNADIFGQAVALDGDTAVIGAPHKNLERGQAYIFVRNGTSWSEQAKLFLADGQEGDWFGKSVAISGDTVLVSAQRKTVNGNVRQGQANVYVRTGTSWIEQAKLVDPKGMQGDTFGFSVSLSQDTALIAAPGMRVGAGQGVADVYVRSGTNWSKQAQLVAADGDRQDSYGSSVAVSGDVAVVGAPGAAADGIRTGAAYAFVRTGSAWSGPTKLVASDRAHSDNFGLAVAAEGNFILIGASTKWVKDNRSQGQAYVFLRTGSSWNEYEPLKGADGEAGDYFGDSVAIDGDTVLVGAPGKAFIRIAGAGQAYLFQRPPPAPNGTPCTFGAQCRSTFCVDGVCCDGACGGGSDSDCQSCRGALTNGGDGVCGLITKAAGYSCRPPANQCDRAEVCDGTNWACPPNRQ